MPPDRRNLPRLMVGDDREPNRYLVLAAHDPIFRSRDRPFYVEYPGSKLLGEPVLLAKGPWLAVLQRCVTNAEHRYSCIQILPVSPQWGYRPLTTLREAVRRQADYLALCWNESRPTGFDWPPYIVKTMEFP